MSDIKGIVTCNVRQLNHTLFVMELDWVADKITGEVKDQILPDRIDGKILCVDTKPDATIPPDDEYNVVLTDPLGIDVMAGALNDRSQTAAQRAWPSNGVGPTKMPMHECLMMAITDNTQGSAMGKVKIYYKQELGRA